MTQESPAVEGAHIPHHTAPYFAVYAALMVLLGVTIGAAYEPLGPLNLAAALTIAFVKGLLVVIYFMHLRDSPRLTWLVVAGTFVWLVILIVGFVEDYWSRSFPGEM